MTDESRVLASAVPSRASAWSWRWTWSCSRARGVLGSYRVPVRGDHVSLEVRAIRLNISDGALVKKSGRWCRNRNAKTRKTGKRATRHDRVWVCCGGALLGGCTPNVLT